MPVSLAGDGEAALCASLGKSEVARVVREVRLGSSGWADCARREVAGFAARADVCTAVVSFVSADRVVRGMGEECGVEGGVRLSAVDTKTSIVAFR